MERRNRDEDVGYGTSGLNSDNDDEYHFHPNKMMMFTFLGKSMH